MNRKKINEFLHVLVIIFPLTLIIPNLMKPMLAYWQLEPSTPLATLLIDSVIVACAVFVFLPWLNKLTNKLFS